MYQVRQTGGDWEWGGSGSVTVHKSRTKQILASRDCRAGREVIEELVDAMDKPEEDNGKQTSADGLIHDEKPKGKAIRMKDLRGM